MENNNLQKTGKAIGFRMIDPHYREPKKAPFVVPDVTLNKKEEAFCKWHNHFCTHFWTKCKCTFAHFSWNHGQCIQQNLGLLSQ